VDRQGSGVLRFHDTEADAAWWAKISFFIGLTLQIVFLYFAEIFPENIPPRWGRLVAAGLPLLIFLPALLNGRFLHAVGFHHDRFHVTLTRYAYAAGLYNILILWMGLWTLRTKYLRYRNTIWAKQIASVIASVLITGILMVGSGNLLPAMGV